MDPTSKPPAREVAIVTGGAKGIGLGIATELGRGSRAVVLFDLDRQSLDDAVSQLEEQHIEAVGIPVDVTNGVAVNHSV
jgi:3-oxoacyl-[acyl-carrier protein] reductase